MEELQGVLREFSVPIDVIDGNSRRREDVALVQTLFNSSIKDNKINYDKLSRRVNLVVDNSLEGAQEQVSECIFNYVKGYLAAKKYV